MHTSKNKNGGFVTTIVLIIVALVALKYIVHFDLVEYLKSPGPQKIIQEVWAYIKDAYNWLDNFVGQYLGKKS